MIPVFEDNSMYKIRVLDSDSELIVPESSLERTLPVSHLPESHEDVDPKAVSAILSKEDLERLWNNRVEKFNEDELLYAYWHRRLQHRNKKDMKRLAQKGIIPKKLSKFKRMPLCAA